MIETCKSCVHAHMLPSGDLQHRVCRGAPPQVIGVATPKGIATQQVWPTVNLEHPICGAFRKKILIDTGAGDVPRLPLKIN